MLSLFKKKYRFLALGDSYTIGEGVSPEQRWINQTIEQLKQKNIYFKEPRIIAKTGWTSDELIEAFLSSNCLMESFDFVSILIGVNNQYRGQSLEKYQADLIGLIGYANICAKNKSTILIISIPDYGVTPFAAEKNPKKIAMEIDMFNKVNRTIANDFAITYIDITPESRAHGYKSEYLVSDQLHPSQKMYNLWATKITDHITSIILSNQL